MKLECQSEEPFFLTEDIEAELIAAGYAFKLPSHVRTISIRDLYGWQPGETLSEPVNPEALTAEIDALAAWADDLRQRQSAARLP